MFISYTFLCFFFFSDPELDEPEIQISLPQFVERGQQISLQCNATGEYYPPDEMDWFKNGQRLTSRRNNGVRITKQYSLLKRTFTSNLTIERASMDDGGTYVCRSSDMQITSTKVHVLNGKKKTLSVDKNGKLGLAFTLSQTTKVFKPFTTQSRFLTTLGKKCLLKTLWEKEKMLVTSIFSFSHNIFYPESGAQFII